MQSDRKYSRVLTSSSNRIKDLKFCLLNWSLNLMHAYSVTQSCLNLVTLWTIIHHGPLSLGFSRARILGWLSISPQRIFQTQDWTQVSFHLQLCRLILLLLSHEEACLWVSWAPKDLDVSYLSLSRYAPFQWEKLPAQLVL